MAVVAAFLAPRQAHAANQTWTNAPVDATWQNINNWIGKAAPGDINQTSGNSVNNDVATFNAPLVGGIGGAASPIIPDDATVVNGRSRRIGGITFDSTNCGAYVIWSPSSPQITDGSSTLTTGYLYVSHTNAIRINDSVTNSEAVIVPMLVNLPASTGGFYNLVNNSTNPGVTLTINSIAHAGAATRGTIFFLDGTNASENTVTNLSEGPSTAAAGNAGGITKQGPGTWVVAGPGTFVANSVVSIIQGTLAVKDPAAFGLASAANTSVTNATLRIDGITLNQSSVSLRNGGVIRGNGLSSMINGVNVSAIAGNNSTLATTSPSDVLNVGNAGNTLTGGAADTILHVSGPGIVSLGQPANYIGRWSIDSGTNQIFQPGALGTGANLNINAGGVFDTSPLGPNFYVIDTKAVSANGTGTAVGSTAATISADAGGTVDFASKPITLTFTPTSFAGDTGHPALYCSRGTLAFHGNAITINNASGTPLGVGSYQLVNQASGPISSSGGFVTLVIGSGLAPGNIAEISASGGNLNLVVSAYTPKSLTWKGTDPTTPATWDRQVSLNWLAGATPSTFNFYDSVTFDAAGSAAPTVTLAGVMQPSTLVVDTTATDYTFTGVGQVAGGTSLIKVGSGTLNLQTANTYSGGTAVSNGVVKLGIDEGVGSTGAAGQNDVTLINPGVFDLNNFSNTVNGLNGNGTVDITGGGTSTLNIGFNGNNGVFNGTIKNTSGTLGIVKTGTGIETLTASNSYVGPTIIDLGTLRVTNQYALGAGNSAVTINSGTLDMQTSLVVSNINGGGLILNSSPTTNLLTIITNSTLNSVISGKIGVYLTSGTLRLNAANTYSNGTFLAAGSTLQIGSGTANPGPGTVMASNSVTISQANTGSSSSGFAPPVNTVDGATVTLTSSSTANSYNNQFIGTANSTNIFSGGNGSIGGALSFSNFLGTVIFTNGQYRWFNAVGGSDNTTFVFTGTGGTFIRDAADIVHLGALFGDGGQAGAGGGITGPSVSFPATFWIGGKGIDSQYEGAISGSNNIVKVGAGTWTLDGANPQVLATDSATFTNYNYLPVISYSGTTTVSNGVMKVVSPNDLTSSSAINIIAGAVLDASSMGTVSNFTDGLGNGATAITTNGQFIIPQVTPNNGLQIVGGNGVIKAGSVINNGTINPGFNGTLGSFVAGTLTLSNNLVVNQSATNYFDLSDNPSGKPSDLLNVNGNVGLTGTSYIGIGALNGTIVPGTYALIKYTGTITNESGPIPAGPISNFQLGGALPTTSRATMAVVNAPGEIDLTVSSINSSNLVWSGIDPNTFTNTWDVVNSFTFTNSPAGMVSQFFQLDNVLFDDSGATNQLYLIGNLAPNSITVNSSSNYIFGGPGNIIGDGSLTKSGTGNLTLTNGANAFTGGTVINGGIIKAGTESGANQSDLALGTGPITINTGGQLRLGGNGGGTVVNHFITNNVVINGGTLYVADGAQHLTNSTVTVNANGATLSTLFSGKNLVLDSALGGTGNITITSATNVAGGQVVLNNSSNTISGTVTIATNGNLALVGFAGLSNSVAIDVQRGSILSVLGRSNTTWAIVSGQTLKGAGTIQGKFINALAGSILAPGVAGALGTLTVTNNNTTNTPILTLNGTLNMDLDHGQTVNSDRIQNSNGTNVFGGTLNVNNLGTTLVAGDSFTLFTSMTNTGAFTTVNLPALTGGLVWNNTLALNGKITVTTPSVLPTVPPAITNISLAGTTITFNGTNGQAGATYYLLTSTNIATPLVQWKTISTNVAAGNAFSFSVNGAANPAAVKQFYMLSSTNYNP